MSRAISWSTLALSLLLVLFLLHGCEPRECDTASDCETGVCLDGHCTPCYSSVDCRDDQACSEGSCVARQCVKTADCQSGACFDGICKPCQSALDCGGELICNAGNCQKPECVTTPDCAMGKACQGGLCVICTSDEQCGSPEQMACHYGSCVTRECVDAKQCQGGKVCDQGLCAPCSDTVFCPDQLGCVAQVCQPCTMDADCGVTRQCRSGLCVIKCATDADCATPGALGCRSLYQERPCGTDGFCGGSAGPWPQAVICDPCGKTASGCPSGMCDEDLRCVCATTADCPPSLACVGGRCRECAVDSDCACGHYCAASECHPRCKGDGDCPSSTRCDTGSGRCAICVSDSDCPSGQVCYEDGCVGPCSDQIGGGCAPFVTCNDNQRCGGCGSCTKGPPPLAPVSACP